MKYFIVLLFFGIAWQYSLAAVLVSFFLNLCL